MQKNKREKREEQGVNLPLQMLKGGVVAAVLAAAVLAVAALPVSGGLLNRAVAERCAAAACVPGALAGALYALKRGGRGFLFAGAGVGVAEWLLLLVCGAVCFGGFGGAGETVGSAVGCLCGGTLGGALRALRSGTRKRGR